MTCSLDITMRGAPPPRKPLPVFPDPDEEDPFAEVVVKDVMLGISTVMLLLLLFD